MEKNILHQLYLHYLNKIAFVSFLLFISSPAHSDDQGLCIKFVGDNQLDTYSVDEGTTELMRKSTNAKNKAKSVNKNIESAAELGKEAVNLCEKANEMVSRSLKLRIKYRTRLLNLCPSNFMNYYDDDTKELKNLSKQINDRCEYLRKEMKPYQEKLEEKVLVEKAELARLAEIEAKKERLQELKDEYSEAGDRILYVWISKTRKINEIEYINTGYISPLTKTINGIISDDLSDLIKKQIESDFKDQNMGDPPDIQIGSFELLKKTRGTAASECKGISCVFDYEDLPFLVDSQGKLEELLTRARTEVFKKKKRDECYCYRSTGNLWESGFCLMEDGEVYVTNPKTRLRMGVPKPEECSEIQDKLRKICNSNLALDEKLNQVTAVQMVCGKAWEDAKQAVLNNVERQRLDYEKQLAFEQMKARAEDQRIKNEIEEAHKNACVCGLPREESGRCPKGYEVGGVVDLCRGPLCICPK